MTRRAQALRDVTINGCDVYQIVGNSEVLFAMIDADVTIALLVRRINSNNNVYDKMERRRSSSCKMSLCKSASSFLGYEDSSVDADCGSGWKYAPQVVLVKIYFFLNDTDRAVMARVCRNWSLAFEAGCLWRRRRFEMGGYRARTAEFQASGFAEKFGQHLRYLTISCNHPSLVTCKIFQRAMEAFLPKLQRKAKLKEFRFSRLEMDRYWRYEQLKEKLILTLTRFLRQQFCLRVLDLSYSQFYLSAGLRIIESVGLSCGHCLRRLMMEDIFHSRLTVYSGLRYKRAMSRFTNLRTLSLNYGYLSDDVMEILRGNLAGKLKTMRVRVYRSDPHGHRITKLAWNGLRRACPSLKVKFNFESIGFASDIIPILVAGIPLYELYIWTGFDDNSDWRLSSTLNHVAANFKDSLGRYKSRCSRDVAMAKSVHIYAIQP